VAEAGRALREARRTLSIARAAGDQRSVVTAGMLTVDRLLARAAEDNEVARTIEEVLAPLRRLQPARTRALFETLAAYLDAGASKTAAAETLGIRRQSLYARLAQLDELVGPLADPERRLAVHIALRASRVAGVLATPAARPVASA
jgi:purine catabolism regulator